MVIDKRTNQQLSLGQLGNLLNERFGALPLSCFQLAVQVLQGNREEFSWLEVVARSNVEPDDEASRIVEIVRWVEENYSFDGSQ